MYRGRVAHDNDKRARHCTQGEIRDVWWQGWLMGKLIQCFKILKGFTNVDANRLFLIDDSSRTRSKGVKLRYKQLHLDCTKFFFTSDVLREWNKLPPSVVLCNTINSFKNKLDRHLLQQ